jgi:hypothetical protein
MTMTVSPLELALAESLRLAVGFSTPLELALAESLRLAAGFVIALAPRLAASPGLLGSLDICN